MCGGRAVSSPMQERRARGRLGSGEDTRNAPVGNLFQFREVATDLQFLHTPNPECTTLSRHNRNTPDKHAKAIAMRLRLHLHTRARTHQLTHSPHSPRAQRHNEGTRQSPD